MTHDELSDVKTVCTEITKAAVPDDVFLIEENFDDLCQPREAGDIQREGRFISPEMLVTFGAAVVTFLLSVFTDAIKDLLKKRVVETLKRLYVKKEKPSSAEINQLQTDLLQLLDRSALAASEKVRLREGFVRVLTTHANES